MLLIVQVCEINVIICFKCELHCKEHSDKMVAVVKEHYPGLSMSDAIEPHPDYLGFIDSNIRSRAHRAGDLAEAMPLESGRTHTIRTLSQGSKPNKRVRNKQSKASTLTTALGASVMSLENIQIHNKVDKLLTMMSDFQPPGEN